MNPRIRDVDLRLMRLSRLTLLPLCLREERGAGDSYVEPSAGNCVDLVAAGNGPFPRPRLEN